ncbi:MAG: hypothetical protein ACRCZJ_04845 [Erysipelotrichaceae bacterium]
MELMVIILQNPDHLEPLLAKYAKEDFRGATIFDSTGMATTLANADDQDEFKFFGALRTLLNPEHVQSKTILMVIQQSRLEQARQILESQVGDLSQPNTGILFTVPISQMFGGSFK